MRSLQRTCFKVGESGRKNWNFSTVSPSRVVTSLMAVMTKAVFQLHHFSAASEFGYGTVTYLTKEAEKGTVTCSFILAKPRTAPLQYVSVPRLELQAATISARLHRMILKEIDVDISSSYFWTDSKITLQYINNESRGLKPMLPIEFPRSEKYRSQVSGDLVQDY